MDKYTDYELVEGWLGSFKQRFPAGQVPEPGVSFVVEEEEWDDSGEIPLRTIKKITVMDVGLTGG